VSKDPAQMRAEIEAECAEDVQIKVMKSWLESIERDINRLQMRKSTVIESMNVRARQIHDEYMERQKNTGGDK